MKNVSVFFFLIAIGPFFSSLHECSKTELFASKTLPEKISEKSEEIFASKAYFLVDSSYFWSLNSTTQVETKSPLSESEFLVINAPSIGIEELVFLKNRKEDGKIYYSHRSHSTLTYTLECTNIGKTVGWVLRQPASEIAYGFEVNDENSVTKNCERVLMPYQLEKWFNSLNQQIKDMLVTQIWTS